MAAKRRHKGVRKGTRKATHRKRSKSGKNNPLKVPRIF